MTKKTIALLMIRLYATLVVSIVSGCTETRARSGNVADQVGTTSGVTPAIVAMFDLGVVIQGESAQTNRWVQNLSDKPIRVAKTESTCECLAIKLTQLEIASNERILMRISYDGAKEPEFVGSLIIGVTLLNEIGEKVGQIQVPLEIVSKKATNR